MALDGLSSANINRIKDKESIEVQNEVAKLAQQEAELTVQKVKESSSNKEESKKDNKKNQEEEQDETLLLDNPEIKKKKEEGKKYTVIFNKVSNEIEVIDKDANYVIESLEPKDLINILKKTKNPSGILANHSI